jgi:4-diphosphocytidyl-2-C-methyl-D-erythritol kinase
MDDSMTQTWIAPAKLNLFLHITGRRADGYHLLQTVFQFLDVGDELTFTVRQDGEINRLIDFPGVPADQDLTVRAARALQQATHCSLGADISLLKKLPVGGGVGGGSSDAATTLCVLNKLWRTGLSTQQLADIGLQLGADVPVFVQGFAAFAEGVGEQLTPVELPEHWYLVARPPVHVSTAEVFGDPQLTRNKHAITIRSLQTGAVKLADLSNVCEPVAARRYPEIAELIKHLQQFGAPRLTGTGACVFVAFDEAAAAQQALQNLPQNCTGFVARGCNISPLRWQLQRS